jgi:hypothetical protein
LSSRASMVFHSDLMSCISLFKKKPIIITDITDVATVQQ